MFNLFQVKNESDNFDYFIDFYSGKIKNCNGYFIDDILHFSDNQLEIIHNYIQWIFPTTEKSKFNKDAPIMTNEIINNFKNNSKCKENMLKCFKRMLNFYGLKLEDKNVIKNIDYKEMSYDWIYIHLHNHMRITRILKSLNLFGFKEEHDAFLKILKKIKEENEPQLNNAYNYWIYS